MSSVFGGSKQKSSSSNRAFDSINKSFSPLFSQATDSANEIGSFLGGDTSGFNLFKKATGFDAASETGSRGITGNAAAGGLLRSGSTSKALQAFVNEMQNPYANDYPTNLLHKANLGFNSVRPEKSRE